MKLPLFNSTKAAFCTCLPKYSLNTYLGRCGHRCVYCYAVKFPGFRGPVQPRLRLLEQIEGMTRNTKVKLPVMISDCTDPYQPLEREHNITRRCIEVLAKYDFPLLMVTKSDMITRDIDVFKQTPSVVSMTISTPREDIASLIEPCAPPPEKRLSALQEIVESGIRASARIDPILLGINDDLNDVENLVSELAAVGIKQVTVATMKLVRGAFSETKLTLPNIWKHVVEEYVDGKWLAGYKYLRIEKRKKTIGQLRRIVLEAGLSFASCREGFPEMSNALCDGTDRLRRTLGISASDQRCKANSLSALNPMH